MQRIGQMLTGELPMPAFAQALQTDGALRDAVRLLVPPEAKTDMNHPFWKRVSYTALERYGFDYLVFVLALTRFDGTIGDALNLFSFFESAYMYYHPETACTTAYREAHGVYLDAVGTFYEGPEVTALLNRLVTDALPIKPKSKRTKLLRETLKETFHIVDNKRPYWIQGGEWPMGEKSPMQYLGRERIPDGLRFTFRDVDTGAIRAVEQHY